MNKNILVSLKLILLSLFILLLGSSSSQAASVSPSESSWGGVNHPQKEFWGMMHSSNFENGDASVAARAGVGTIRLRASWYQADGTTSTQGGVPGDGVYDWTYQDKFIRNAAQNNIRTLLYLSDDRSGGSKLFPLGHYDWTYPAEGPAWNGTAYLNFIRAVVERYGPNGYFWSENPSVPYVPVNTYEVWNEQNYNVNNPSWTSAGGYISEYAKFLQTVSDKIKSSVRTVSPNPQPQVKVLVGGLAADVNISDGVSGVAYVKSLSEQSPVPGVKMRQYFDGISFHPYSGSPGQTANQIKGLREQMDKVGFKGKAIYITELGWATGGPVQPGLTLSTEEQARYVKESMSWIKDNKTKYKIDLATWYFWRDSDEPTNPAIGLQWDSFTGLFYLDGTEKLSWKAYLDTTAEPETTIVSSYPANGATSELRFTSNVLSSNVTSARFECRTFKWGGVVYDWTPCSSPAIYYSNIINSAGIWVFQARAIDPLGNIDQTPAASVAVIP